MKLLGRFWAFGFSGLAACTLGQGAKGNEGEGFVESGLGCCRVSLRVMVSDQRMQDCR